MNPINRTPIHDERARREAAAYDDCHVGGSGAGRSRHFGDLDLQAHLAGTGRRDVADARDDEAWAALSLGYSGRGSVQ